MLGEQFMVGPEVCGAVVSLRYQVCINHYIMNILPPALSKMSYKFVHVCIYQEHLPTDKLDEISLFKNGSQNWYMCTKLVHEIQMENNLHLLRLLRVKQWMGVYGNMQKG